LFDLGRLAKNDLAFAYLRRGIARAAIPTGRSARAMIERSKTGSAVESLDEAMALGPKWGQSYVDRGVARMARGQFDDAIDV
jgi:Flp pilus assembly protein TadD